MKKAELVSEVADKVGLTVSKMTEVLDSVLNTIMNATTKQQDQVTIAGFGTFQVKERAARTGRNPRTGEVINIPATKVPGFKAAKAYKDMCNE